MQELTPYQIWQLAHYGNIVGADTEHEEQEPIKSTAEMVCEYQIENLNN